MIVNVRKNSHVKNMITFKITLLVGLNFKAEVKKVKPSKKHRKDKKSGKGSRKSKKSNKTSKKRSKKSSKKSKKSTKKSKKSSKKGKSKKTPKPEEQYPEFVQENENIFVLNAKQPLGAFHIDYDLYPGKFKYTADVVCWGPAAKIFTVDGTKCLKTVTKNDITYIPISIEHYFKNLSDEDILKLTQHVITFNIKIGKQKLGRLAKSEKKKTLYLLSKYFDSEDFPEVLAEKPFILEPVDSKESLKEAIRRMLDACIFHPTPEEAVSRLPTNIDLVHAFKIKQLMKKLSLGERIRCKENHIEKKEKKKDKKKEKKKKKHKKKDKKNKNSKNLTVSVPAEVLFTDPTYSIFEFKQEEEDSNVKAFVLLSSKNLLTNKQKFHFNPMVVKIHKVSNLPWDLLEKNGITKIYLQCTIPNIGQFKTLPKPISNTVFVDEARFIPVKDVEKMKLLNILQTSCVTVEIFGVKEEKTEVKSTKGKKGKKKDKRKKTNKSISTKSKKKSKKGSTKSSTNPDQPEEVKISLATATIDVSSLHRNFWNCKEKVQIHNRDGFRLFPGELDTYFVDRITMNELSLAGSTFEPLHSQILLEEVLIRKNTTLKFEAFFMTPQHPSYYISDLSKTYQRLLVVLFSATTARDFLDEIISENYKVIKFGLFPVNFCTQRLNDVLVTHWRESEFQQLLTGFLIDDGDNFMFYIEGQSNGAILNLIHYVSTFDLSKARVFYNSKYLFEERLYESFVNFYGFFVITLRMPLRDLLARQKCYLKGNVPIPCWMALQKINLIIASNSLKVILNHDLMPSELELLSFALEYGMHLEYKTADLKYPSIVTSEVIANTKGLFGNNSKFST